MAGKDPDSEGSPGPNITRKGNPGKWNFEEFNKAMQTGQTPEGKILNPEKMPWPHYAVMSDVELKSLWVNLNSLQILKNLYFSLMNEQIFPLFSHSQDA